MLPYYNQSPNVAKIIPNFFSNFFWEFVEFFFSENRNIAAAYFLFIFLHLERFLTPHKKELFTSLQLVLDM
jgi:hypothetical protein